MPSDAPDWIRTSDLRFRRYPVPASGQTGVSFPENTDWSQIFGAHTKASTILPGAYPLCTLTYIEALREYPSARFSAGTAATVKDYIRDYLLEPEGQEALEVGGRWYAPISEGQKPFDVLGAARTAAAAIRN